MKAMLRAILRAGYHRYGRIRHPRFYELKARAHGMLNPLIYRRMYLLARKLPDLDIVEIGGAAGAGSVALALGMKESGKRSGLIVVEKLQGGSRASHGDYQRNLEIINGNFRSFGVEDVVRLYPHEITMENGSEVWHMIRTPEIAAFMHDADGRLDRDFFLFWPVLRPGGLIIVDDYANSPHFKPISERNPQGGIKSVMTFRLLNQMIEWGLFQPTRRMGNTIFGIKPVAADFSRFDREACRRIIEQVERERDHFLAGAAPELATR
jgi:predicted O-methyltransferase YrrM